MTTAAPIESVRSRDWEGPSPAVTVVVSTHGRAALLSGLLDALEAQQDIDAEVVVADNGSEDGTWSVLIERCRTTSLRLLALRLPFHNGPAVPRNTCAAASRAPLIAFTDDDCLPTPTWLAGLVAAFDDPTVIVQGKTVPEPGGWAGPWGRTVSVSEASGLYETANLAVRTSAFRTAGGFPEKRLLTGRAFGEDVLLGAAVARLGEFRFAADAVVQHRVMPGDYRDFISERRRLAGFPLLLRKVPELRSQTFAKVFLSRRTAITDLGLAGFIAGIVCAFVEPIVFEFAFIATLPWILLIYRESYARGLGYWRPLRHLRVAVGDVVGFGALLVGSLRARRLLL